MTKLSIADKLNIYRSLTMLNDDYADLCKRLGYSATGLPQWKDAVTKLTTEIKNDLFNGALDGTVAIPNGDK